MLSPRFPQDVYKRQGYLRLILPTGGCYVIADRALEPR